jgi:hypothetical protein
MPSAGGYSAARTETDDAHILKDCPCCCKPVGEEGRFYLDARRFINNPILRPILRNISAELATVKV